MRWTEAPFLLRNMLFTIPIKVAGLSALGFSFQEIVFLEAAMLVASSLTQLLGAYIDRRLSSRHAFFIGKAIAALACILLATLELDLSMAVLGFSLWGIGVGIFEGSDILSGKRNAESWHTTMRRVELLGLVGSLLGFLLGPQLFGLGGLSAALYANAVASIATLAFLYRGLAPDRSNDSRKTEQKKMPITQGSLLAIASFSLVTISVKVGFLVVQEKLLAIGVDPRWNALLFVFSTVAVIALIQIPRSFLRTAIVGVVGASLVSFYLADSAIVAVALSTAIVVLSRASQKVLFLVDLVEAANSTNRAVLVSTANLSAGVLAFLGSLTVDSESAFVALFVCAGSSVLVHQFSLGIRGTQNA